MLVYGVKRASHIYFEAMNVNANQFFFQVVKGLQ